MVQGKSRIFKRAPTISSRMLKKNLEFSKRHLQLVPEGARKI
jgi:hypothetical protein